MTDASFVVHGDTSPAIADIQELGDAIETQVERLKGLAQGGPEGAGAAGAEFGAFQAQIDSIVTKINDAGSQVGSATRTTLTEVQLRLNELLVGLRDSLSGPAAVAFRRGFFNEANQPVPGRADLRQGSSLLAAQERADISTQAILDRAAQLPGVRAAAQEQLRQQQATPQARTDDNRQKASEANAAAGDEAYLASTVEAATARKLLANNETVALAESEAYLTTTATLASGRAALEANELAAKAEDENYLTNTAILAGNRAALEANELAAKAADEDYLANTAQLAANRAALAANEDAAKIANEDFAEKVAIAAVNARILSEAIEEATARLLEEAGFEAEVAASAAALATKRNAEATATAEELGASEEYLTSMATLAAARNRQAVIENLTLAADEDYLASVKEAAASKKILAKADGSGGGGRRGGPLGNLLGDGIGGALSTGVGFLGAQVFFQVLAQLQQAIREAVDFQDAMTRIKVVLDQTGQSNALAAVQTGLIGISQEANIAASTLAAPFLQAQGVFGGAADGLKAVDQAAQLAKLSGDNLATSMQELVVIATSFGVSASNLGQINDAVFGAFERYGTPVSQTTAALKLLADTGDAAGFSLTYLTDLVGKASQTAGQPAVTEAQLLTRALTAIPSNEGKILQFAQANGLTGVTTNTFDQGPQAVVTAIGKAINQGQLTQTKLLELTELFGGGGRVAPAVLPLLQAAASVQNDQGVNDTGKAAAAFATQMGDLKESFGRAETSLKDVISVGLVPFADAVSSTLGPLDQAVGLLLKLGSIKIPGVPGQNVLSLAQRASEDLAFPFVEPLKGAVKDIAGLSKNPAALISPSLGNHDNGSSTPADQKGADDNDKTRQKFIIDHQSQLDGLLNDAALDAKSLAAVRAALDDPTNKTKFEAAIRIYNAAAKTPAGKKAIADSLAAAIVAADAAHNDDVAETQGLFDVGRRTRDALQAALAENIAFNTAILADFKAPQAAQDAAAKQLASDQKQFNTNLQAIANDAIANSQLTFEQNGLDRSPIDKAHETVIEAADKVRAASQEIGPDAAKDMLAAEAAYVKALNDYAALQITEADAVNQSLDDIGVALAVSPADQAAGALKRDTDKLNALIAHPTGDAAVDQAAQNAAQAQIDNDKKQAAANARSDALALSNSQFGLTNAQDAGNAAAQARNQAAAADAALKRAQGETGIVDPATQQADINNATAQQVAAQRAIAQSLEDLYNAQHDLVAATLAAAGDVVGADQQKLDEAKNALASAASRGIAAGTTEYVKLQQDVVNAQAALAHASVDAYNSQQDIIIAQLTAVGDSVGVAREKLKEAQHALAANVAQGGKAGDTEYNQLYAGVIDAQTNVANATVSQAEQRIQDQLALKQITVAQAVAELTALEAVTKDQNVVQQLRVKVKELLSSASNLQFDLPTDIALPTLYESRRLNQTPGGAGYADNRNITVSLNVFNGADVNAAVGTIVAAVSAPPSYGSSGRIY